MPKTLVSSVLPLCPVAEFLKRIDNLAVAKLASDVAGVPVPQNQLATNENILACLKDASGLFESAVMMGAQYQADDLQVLRTTDCSSRGMMFRIISDMAWTFLFERRPNETVTPPASVMRSLQWMELLSQGKRIFAFVETQEATIMHRAESSDADVEARNGVVVQARPYYGIRSDQQQMGGNNDLF